MRCFLVGCCLGLLGTAPVAAADYLNGDWFVLTGKNKISTSNPDHPAVKDLAKFAKDNWEVRFLVFPADSSYVFHLAGGLWGINPPDSLWKKEDELGKAKLEVKSIALMAQGGWAILYDKSELAQDGIPADVLGQLQAAIKDVKAAGGTLRSLAFAPNGGWVLLFDKDFKEHGLPRFLSQALAQRKQKGLAVRCVAFNSHGDWFLLDDANDYATNTPSHPACKKLQELRAQGETLQWITFTPGVYSDCILEHHPVKRIRAVHTVTADNPAGGIEHWAVLPAQFPELARQRDIKVTIDPPGGSVPDTGPLKQEAMLAQVSGHPNGLQTKVTSEMTLYTNRLVPLLAGQTPPERDLPPEVAKLYTQLSGDTTAKLFQDFLDEAKLRREPKEPDVVFARRVFLYISLHFKYGPNKDGVDTVQSSTGDCGGLAWVFVRTMRANGVPARMIFGRWAASEVPPKDGQPGFGQWHAKAEFFASGLGWVAIDMSGGVGQQAGGNPLVCFGNEPGDFVVFDLDISRQVVIFPGDTPATIAWSQGTWVFPRPDPGKVKWSDHWTVETLDLHPAATPYRPDWKYSLASGPSLLPSSPAPAPPIQGSAQPKTADDSPPAEVGPPKAARDGPTGESGEKGAEWGWVWPWLPLSVAVAGFLVLALGLLFLKRGRAPQAVAPVASVKVRCVRCGMVVKVLSGAAGKRFQCPRCGVIQRIGA
jgi:transglutaminase-like putative cysteine protease